MARLMPPRGCYIRRKASSFKNILKTKIYLKEMTMTVKSGELKTF